MPLLNHDQKYVDAFFEAIEPFREGYKQISFSYLAIKGGDDFTIIRARLWFSVAGSAAPLSHFASQNVRAGRYSLSELKLGARQFIETMIEGNLTTPGGDLRFPPSEGGRHSAYFTPFYAEALQTQRKIGLLRIVGKEHNPLPQTELDWELKASNPPYDGLQELAAEYFLGPLSIGPSQVELIAANVAEVDTVRSTVSGDRAHFFVVLASGLRRGQMQLGYRVLHQGKIVARSIVDPRNIEWVEEQDRQFGKTSFDVPSSAVVNGVVSFAGVAQHHWWFSDPSTFQNTRRAVYEAFDPKLEKLRDSLEKAQGRGQDARQLEPAVAWVMWMLGFAVAHLGGSPRLQDAADVIATSPAGNFAVIECTTGLLRADNKLAILHDRAEAVRRSLAMSNQAFRRVIAIIVTSKTRAEIKPELEHAEKGGVLVVTRDEFNQLVDRTLALPDAEKIYAEAEEAIRAAQDKFEAQQKLL